MNSKNLTFESERLRFRGIERRDAEQIVAWRNDDRINAYFIHHKTLTLEEHLAWYEAYLKNPDRYDYIIICKQDNRPIGTVTLRDFSDLTRVDIGYAIAEVAYQKKGYAGEAITALMHFGAKQFGVSGVRAEIHVDNTASIRTVEKLHFQQTELKGQFAVYQRLMI